MADKHTTHICACTVGVAAAEADAGSAVTLTVSMACDEGCELAGHIVAILDAQGAEAARGELVGEQGEWSTTVQLVLPAAVGSYVYKAALLKADEAVTHVASPVAFELVAKAHHTWINVWGTPAAVAPGERVHFNVGIKCSCGCNLAGRQVKVVDASGRAIAKCRVSERLWPGTALHQVEVEAPAPEDHGTHRWRVMTRSSSAAPQHEAGLAEFSFHVVDADCEVTIEAIDRESNVPIANARVVIHPHQAVTDANGLARLRVARGDHRLQVAGRKYMPVTTSISVTGHLATRAELSREPPPRSPDEGY